MTKGWISRGIPKANFEPGYDLHAKITILAEGARGSCTKQLIERFQLEDPEHAPDIRGGDQRVVGDSGGPGG